MGLITPKEAAVKLGLPQARFRKLMHKGVIPSLKDGGRYYIPSQSIDRLLTKIDAGELKVID